MSDDATPAKVRLTDGLGLLPEARWKWAGNGPRPYEDAYSADQMRAYARAALAQRQPLTDEQIRREKPVCADFVSFRAGVRCAERMHEVSK